MIRIIVMMIYWEGYSNDNDYYDIVIIIFNDILLLKKYWCINEEMK